ncbi:threonine/serine exporter family protein [Jatrophihabitans fulvus]
MDTADVYKTMNLALRVGELLLSSGAGASDVAAQMDNVGRACGLRRFTSDVTFTELAMSFQPTPDEPAIMQVRQVRQREVDYEDLTLVDHLVRDLVSGRIDRDEATARIKRIVSTGHARPRWAVTLGFGGLGAGVGMLLGGNAIMVLIAFVAACLVDRVQFVMAKARWPVFYSQTAGGLIATLLASGVAKTGLEIAPGRVITASIILLLAGVSFLGAIQDALTGFPLTSAARMLEAVIATAGAIAGVSVGLTIARVAGAPLGQTVGGVAGFAGLPLMASGAAIAAASYAFASYAPLRSLVPIGLIAALAAAGYFLVDRAGFGVAMGSVVAALVIGLVSFTAAGRVRVPALIIVTSALVPLLPGLSIYRGLAVIGKDAAAGLVALFTAGTLAIALSSGVILGEYIAQPLKREARRLEQRLAGPRLVGPMTVRSVRRPKPADPPADASQRPTTYPGWENTRLYRRALLRRRGDDTRPPYEV